MVSARANMTRVSPAIRVLHIGSQAHPKVVEVQWEAVDGTMPASAVDSAQGYQIYPKRAD